MNKAFVREPDEPDVLRCPACDVAGQPVSADTLAEHLPADAMRTLSPTSAHFCPNPRCTVGYFDNAAAIVAASALTRSVYPKDPSAPVCSCLGVTAQEVLAAAERADPMLVRRVLAHAQAAGARCAITAANGQSCVAQVQPLYLKHLKRR